MKKRFLLSIIASLLIIVLFATSTVVTFAWFTKGKSIGVNESSGGILKQYFHKGDGTEANPYEITRPVHYYNLVMLYQLNPDFKDGAKFIDGSLFFRLGSKDLNLDNVDDGNGYQVFYYDDNGTSNNQADPNGCLNLKSYCNGAFGNGLLPIGSAQKPFQATFDGSGLTLQNLKIIGVTSLNGVEYKTPDVGLFGYVSSIAKVKNLYTSNYSIDLTGVDGSSIYQQVDAALTTEHKTHDDQAFVGYIAGHIVTGADVTDVYVNDCIITGGNAANCKYGYFGHVEDAQGNEVNTLGELIATQRTQGDNAGFGGSMDMKQMHTRLNNILNNTTVPETYLSSETVVINENTGETHVYEGSWDNINFQTNTGQSSGNPVKNRYYATDYAGKYYFNDSNGNGVFMCLYGEGSRMPKTVITYTVTTDEQDAFNISCGGRYLTVADGSITSTDKDNSSKWVLESDGRMYAYYNKKERYDQYYLGASGSSGVFISETATTVWAFDGNGLYTIIDGSKYYLGLNSDNQWCLCLLIAPNQYQHNYQIISNGTGKYLKVAGADSFTETTNKNEATHFFFSNENQGYVTYYYNGTLYYLGQKDGSFSNTATNWVKTTQGYLKAGDTDYYLMYDNGWKIVDCGLYYTISYDNNYLNLNANQNCVTNGNSGNATWWKFSESGTNYPSGTIRAKGTNKYLRGESYSLKISTSPMTWQNSNGKLFNDDDYLPVYLTYSSGWTTRRFLSGVTLTFTKKQLTPTAVTVSTETEQIEMNGSIAEQTTEVVVAKNVKTVDGGYQTYFPLRIAEATTVDKNGNVIDSYDTTKGWYDANDPYRVSLLNTGYVISGSRLEDSNDTPLNQLAYGDIRVSYFSISNVSSSYANNNFIDIYTVDGAGIHKKQDSSPIYEEAKKQLGETLKNSNRVYGLHFMDAEISKDYLVKAKKAVVLGKEYDDYEMPMDSVNFHLVERGAITFFAGDYFDNNNTFFSLHQVFRDENQKIVDIKEISEVYALNGDTSGASKYYYKYTDGTYGDGASVPAAGSSLPAGYTSVFNTEWIKNPGFKDKGTRIFYFEIPVNKGEFCLGSVKEKTGAYLMYLDIGTNGGDAISGIISSDGNEVTNSFKAEYRDAPDILGVDKFSVLLFAINAPAGTDVNSFSVQVRFIKTPAESEYSNGLYEITIINKSDTDLQLDVFLCDDDRDITNDFLYAYRVVYTNVDNTGQIIKTTAGREYWKSMASFTIPRVGAASEIQYQP